MRCSVVWIGYDNVWHYPDELDHLQNNMKQNESPATTLQVARDLFGRANVRFYGGGIPDVFCDGNKANNNNKFNQLITW